MPRWETKMYVIKMSFVRHHNKSQDYENNDKYLQKPKTQ